jgi:hypothetical protein
MGEVNPQPIDLAAAEGVHVIFRYERAFTLLDPGKLDLFVPVKVRIKMGQDILLDDHGFVTRHGDGKL